MSIFRRTDRASKALDRPGGVLAVLGALLTGLAYALLPVAKVPLVGEVAAPALNELASEYGSLALIPFVPLAALVTLAVGVYVMVVKLGRGGQRTAGIVVLACSAYIALAYLVPFNALESEIREAGASGLGISAATFTGSGFWFALVGALVSAIGAALELSRPKRSLLTRA